MNDYHNSEERDYKEYYIAYLDIIGFKNLIKEKTASEILDIFESYNEAGIRCINLDGENLIDDYSVKTVIMSDSICAYVDVNAKNAFLAIIMWCAHFQATLVMREEPVMLRGGIVKGKLYVKGNVVFGPGLVMAYQLEESIANNPRVILPKEYITKEINACNKTIRKIISGCVFEDKDKLFCVNYMNLIVEMKQKTELVRIHKYLLKLMASDNSTYYIKSVRDKYLYTIEKLEVFLGANNGRV